MQRTIDIQSIEIDGKHFVTVSMDGRELRRRGPFPNASTAEIMADRLVQHWLVNLPIDATSNLTENHEFLADLARFSEGLYSEQDIKKKHYLDDSVWESLGNDEGLIRAIEAEKIRRMRSGATARERAQVLFATAPTTLGNILNNDNMPARHRIEAAKEIRAVAATGPETTPTSDRFVIQINLGEDYKLRFDKSITPVSNDKDVEIIDTTPQELLPMIAAKNRKEDGGNGEPI
jgi:hypothetical protein